ncbi:MAG TPA: class I adenylate-forming enzyme family protein [Acidimicrobiales bacterium]|nr:class I adenylate-forming enzyme family protein [Acidimicrobiales bacterium]
MTAPGERFETDVIDVRGIPTTVFRNAPGSLRELFAAARSYADQTFLVYEDERWSFDDVMRHVDALGALLVEDYGVGPGDRVAIGMRNYPEWVMAFAAITSIGAISVSLNAWWTEDELGWALDDCGAKVLVADRERVERTVEPAAKLGVQVLGVRLGDADLPDADRWEEALPLGRPLPPVEIDPDDDATILYTSGTTGRPKGAVSTHRAVVQALSGFGCRAAVDRLRRAPGGGEAPDAPAERPSFILIVPLFHVTGAVPVMMSCFANGLKLVIMYKWDPERALELIERERVTNFVGVPTQSWDLLQSPRFAEFDTSSLISVGGGGAPAPPELVRRVSASFAKASPNIGYGMTETNSYGPQNGGADYLSHPTSTGRATPILSIEIRDDAGVAVPAGERGEIWFKGPNLIRGYWNRPEDTAETIVDGWLRTGDIGRIDEEGFVYVEDRAKDMVLRGGENVFCAEVEAAIYEHPAVHEAAVFGVPHERLGEEVAAVVVPRPGVPLTAAEVQEHVAARLAAFKVPSRVEISVAPLPRNPAGKILKRDLRDAFGR